MSTATIRLEVDPISRKRTISISLQSDAGMLPNEHEEEHKAVVKKLMAGGLIEEGDTIHVERAPVGAHAVPTPAEQAPVRSAVQQKS